jgi:GH24 family phage-related lysozyme (muramidase)
MPKLKLINALEKVISEIRLGGLGSMVDPETNKTLDSKFSVDYTKPDTDAPGKVIGKWDGELGTSTKFPTTCDAPLEEQVFKIIRESEGFISRPQWDQDMYRIGYGSSTVTYEDGTSEYLPNVRPPHTCDNWKYCKHPSGNNKYGTPWIDFRVTEEDSDRDFKRITKVMRDKMEKYVGSDIWSETPDCVKSGLNSLAYNCGSVMHFILDAVKEKDYCKVADGVEKVCPTSLDGTIDLTPRRKREADWIRECTKCSNSSEFTNDEFTNDNLSTPANIIIGDSQTPHVDNRTSKAQMIPGPEGESTLHQGSTTVNWLRDSVKKYPVSPGVKNVILCTGTNGGFGNYQNDVDGLFSAVKKTFPNAKIYAVQGSWGWGGNSIYTETNVRNYYKKYESLGATLIEPPIGCTNTNPKTYCDPHGPYPVYGKIGEDIDNNL